MSKKATQKMIDYAKGINEWVKEKMPDTDDFDAVSAYIDRNKDEYRLELELDSFGRLASSYRGDTLDL